MKIAIFGTGSALHDFLSLLPTDHDIVALADNNAARWGDEVAGITIVPPSELPSLNVDLVVITLRAVDAVRAQLQDLGVPANRIAAYYPSYSAELATTVNADIARLNEVLDLNLPMAGVATMYLWPEHKSAIRSCPGEDFVRRQAMRLCANWIMEREVPGAIAELGVYQGEQAALLNALFPERPLYLLDTFEGFACADVQREQKSGFSASEVGQFKDTSVEMVMGRMTSPQNTYIRKGFFPESAQDMAESYAFVSLDVDLFEPILAGLEYFYPRLAEGGFIFVHDYNNVRFKGVRSAVDQFLAHTRAPALPLPDFAGSLVILR